MQKTAVASDSVMWMVQVVKAEKTLGSWKCVIIPTLQMRQQRVRRAGLKPQCNPTLLMPHFRCFPTPSSVWYWCMNTMRRSQLPWPFTCVRAHGQSWKPEGGRSLHWCYNCGEAGTFPRGETDPGSHRGDWRQHRCLFWKQRTDMGAQKTAAKTLPGKRSGY